MSAIFGAIALLILFCLFLVVIWRLCNAKSACAAQSSHVPTDDQLEMYDIAKAISAGPTIICTQEGMFRVNERGEWVPFEGGR
jgi:purine-cytosine permease-like protein